MSENGNGHKKYAFADFRIETAPEILRCGSAEIHLAKRPFQVLNFLIENRERVVSRDELLDKFWDGRDVYDDALRKSVGAIRHALDDTSKHSRFIETRYGYGYRFIGNVDELPASTNGNGALEGLLTKSTNEKSLENTKTKVAAEKKWSVGWTLFTSVAVCLSIAALGYYFLADGKIDQPNTTAEAPATIRSIAVMPLKNLTGNDENEYLSDGVTDSIITELSRVSELRVVSRGSTFAFKDKEIDPRELGKKLNVNALLEGSIQKKGELLSANMRLISTSDGRVLWVSQEFERHASTAYELQAIISRNIAIALQTEFADADQKRNTQNADAYQAYLKGRFHWNKRTANGIRKSIEFYEQAIAFDPNYSLAYSGLAESYVQGIWHVPFDGKEVLPKAEVASLKAIELDESSSEAHTALAGVYSLKWNWEATGGELRRAIELNPRNARACHVQAFYFMLMGRYVESVLSIEKALELDPLNNVVNTDYATLLFIAKRKDEAFQQWGKTVEMDPSFALAHLQMANAHIVLGNESAAISELIKEKELSDESTVRVNSFREMLARGGIKRLFENTLSGLTLRETRGERVSPVAIAWQYAYLGQKEKSIVYLKKAYDEHSPDIVLIVDRHFSSALNSDPRYLEIIRNIGVVHN
jgi:TolB-like protein/DNA-binding winged helix-turn-helix (wHTH) protein/Tfp pilus assembly protein PilF